jgi:hypothetical protein
VSTVGILMSTSRSPRVVNTMLGIIALVVGLGLQTQVRLPFLHWLWSWGGFPAYSCTSARRR